MQTGPTEQHSTKYRHKIVPGAEFKVRLNNNSRPRIRPMAFLPNGELKVLSTSQESQGRVWSACFGR